MKPRVQIYGSCESLLAQFPPHRSRPAWAAVPQMLFVTRGGRGGGCEWFPATPSPGQGCLSSAGCFIFTFSVCQDRPQGQTVNTSLIHRTVFIWRRQVFIKQFGTSLIVEVGSFQTIFGLLINQVSLEEELSLFLSFFFLNHIPSVVSLRCFISFVPFIWKPLISIPYYGKQIKWTIWSVI